MATSYAVINFLRAQDVPYELEAINVADIQSQDPQSLIDAAENANIPAASLFLANVFEDSAGLIMTVLPSTHVPQLETMKQRLRRRYAPISAYTLSTRFPSYKIRSIPPLGQLHGVTTLFDDTVDIPNNVYFSSGSEQHLIRIQRKHFIQLQRKSLVLSGFSKKIGEESEHELTTKNNVQSTAGKPAASLFNVRKRIETLGGLPAMPEMAREIFKLKNDPNAGAEELAGVVEFDPALSAQVIRYACSPFFSFPGKVDSVQTAIARVLGYDMVLNLALGIVATRTMNLPQNGPLGTQAFWRHAIYTAALSQQIVKILPADIRPSAGTAYLAGLLHNIGYLLAGHMFPEEFRQLNRLIVDNPDTPVSDLDLTVFGATHEQLGAWLMQSWQMPRALITTSLHHHNETYDGQEAIYSQIVLIAIRLLGEHGIGDNRDNQLPPRLLKSLGLEEVQLLATVNELLSGCDNLNGMAEQLAA